LQTELVTISIYEEWDLAKTDIHIMLDKSYILSAGRMLRLEDLVGRLSFPTLSRPVTENVTTACTTDSCSSTV